VNVLEGVTLFMAGSHISLIVMPIVIALALTFWVSLVYRASFNPLWRHHARRRRTEVAGGVFEARHSARQLEPLWGEPVEEIPQPREAAHAESYRAADAQTAEQEPGASGVAGVASAESAGAAGPGAVGASAASAGARSGATATASRATGSRPPTESGPTGSGWPPE